MGIRELRSELAAVVRRAAAGESVVVTVSGRAVAVLGPLVTATSEPSLDDLVAAGAIVGPRRHGGEQPILRERLPVDARSDAELRKVR